VTWLINGTVTGQYAAPVKIRAFQLDTGIFVAEIILLTGAYQLLVPRYTAYMLTCTTDIGVPWTPGVMCYLGQKVFPLNPAVLTYYFRCIGVGISGQLEPAFSSEPLKTIQDGDCVWERVERIPPPIAQYPIFPVPN
jgi:hypothetical protein